MKMKLAIRIVFVCMGLAVLIGIAMAQMTSFADSPMVPTANPQGSMLNGGLGGPMVPGSTATPAPPVDPCGTGVIDLSTGCTMPMLGGL